jgi:MFS family permease
MAAIAFFLVNYNWNIVATLLDLIPDLGLSETEFGLLFTAPTLAGILVSIPGGMLADRYGIRRVLGTAVVVTTVGCLLRVTATGFEAMFAYNFLMGIGLGVLFALQPQLVGLWFPPRQVGLATGLYMMSMGVGMALGLATGPMYPTWQSAFLFPGIAVAVITVLWIVFGRDRPAGVSAAETQLVGFREGMGRALRSRNMWFVNTAQFLVGVLILAYIGSLPYLLTEFKGMVEESASLISALAVVGFTIGTIFWPVMSEVVGIRNPIFMVTMVLTGISAVLVWFLAPGAGMWALAFFPGFFIAAALTFMMMAPVELQEIGPRYAGNATGILSTTYNLGAFVGLPYMMLPIAAVSADWAFIFLLIVCVITGTLGLAIREIGRKAREKQAG